MPALPLLDPPPRMGRRLMAMVHSQTGLVEGEVWWFDNARTHEVVNNSAGDRIHMIVDIRT